jgi:glutamate/aspartate transport system substrate-binding protein
MKKQVLALAIAALAAGSAFAQANDTLAKIKASGSITEGVRESSGLSYTLGNGQYTGFHYDVCANIIRDIQKHLGLAKLETKYQPVTSQNRVPLVQNGTVDMECGSTTNNTARQQQVAFAPTTFVTNVRTAVKANSGITSIEQLNGKTVATTTGTTSVQLLRKRAGKIDFKELFGKDHADSFLLLESGRADAFVMDDNILAGLIVNSKNPAEFKIVGESLSEEPIAIMMPKDDPAYKKLVDDAVIGLMKSGELEKIYTKWFLAPVPPRNATVGMPMSDSLKSAIATPNDKPAETYKK